MKLLRSRFVIALMLVLTIFGLECPVLNSKADCEVTPKINELDPIYAEVNGMLETNLADQLEKHEEYVETQVKYSDKQKKRSEAKAKMLESIKKAHEPKKTLIGTYELTAYIATGNRCASGVYPTCNHTVACNSLPLGTKLYIDGYGEYTVEDTGGMAGNVIDVFVSDYSTAISFGRRTAAVYVIEN